jgi:hypothetical protein
MASIFDDMPDNPNALGDTGYSFYDADTLYDGEGQGYRIYGVNALEVGTLGKEGQVGGDLSTEQAVRLANDLGYTNVVKLGKVDATGTREMIDLRDAQGRSFSRELAASGMAPVMQGFDPSGELSQAARYRRAMRTSEDYEANEFDLAADAIDDYLTEQDVARDVFRQKRFLPGMEGEGIAYGAGAVFEGKDIDTETGKSLSPLTTAWDTALNGVADAAFGITHMVGDSLGIDTLKDIGYSGTERARDRIKREGRIITDYQDVEGFGSAVEFISNNVAMSIPYMAITALSAAAAPMTGGLSLTAPVSIYTGQIWNEMGDQIKNTDKERSAGIALAGGAVQAALDLVGVKFLTGSLGSTPKAIFNQGVDALVASGAYATKEAAEKYLSTATKRQLAEATGDAAKAAREQLDFKAITMETLKRGAGGLTSEATTEAMQEAIAAIAADIGSETEIDWKDVQDRAIQGAVAGGVLGGTFSASGAILDAGAWANIAYGIAPEVAGDVSEYTTFARDEENRTETRVVTGADGKPLVDANGDPIIRTKKKGYVPTMDENIEEIGDLPDAVVPNELRVKAHENKKRQRTFKESIISVMQSTPALWRGSVRRAIPIELQRKYRSARVAAGMFGGHLQRVFSGHTFEEYKHAQLSKYKNMVGIPQNFFVGMNDGQRVRAGQERELSDYFYAQVRGAIKNGKFDPKLLTETNAAKRQLIIDTVKELDALANQMYDDQLVYNPKLNKMGNYLLRYRALDKAAVHKYRSEFISELRKIPLSNGKYLTEEEAVKLTDQILNGQSGTAEEAFDVLKGGFAPGSHKARTFNLSERKEFDKFMERDLFANVSQAAKSAARYQATQKYVGKNGSVLAKLYDQMQREGATEDEVNEMAYHLHNYLQAESGNYKRPESDLGKFFEAVQKNFMVFVTITALPLATVSSLVELALTTRGLTKDQIFGTKNQKGSLSYLGKELAETLSRGMLEVARLPQATMPSVKWTGATVEDKTAGQKILRKTGFYEWDVGAANTTGVSETHAWHNKLLDKFFKWTGLQGWTNYTRAVRGSFAADFIMDNAKIVMSHDKSKVRTNEVREAEEKLRNLGIPLHKLDLIMDSILELTTPEQEAEVAEFITLATFNFINEAVAMPMASNRPLMYQDPRLALFMQFQGFMATFTANHIPRLWDEYIKRGSPAMKYQTFAMMTTMIMLGFASQYLKDLIKFGGKSPYLDEAEFIQRGVLASGLMGTPERIFNQFFPIYETQTSGAADWLWETASGESPTIGKAKQLVGAGADAIVGDTENAAKNLGRATLGPFYQPLKWAFEGD